MKCTILLMVTTLSCIYGASAWKWEHFDEMPWNAGDRITCRLQGSLVNYHWMIASYDGNVIHIAGDNGNKDGTVREDHFTAVQNMFNRDRCINMGPGPKGKWAVSRARRLVGKRLYYHLLTCNCEHYAKYWSGDNEFWNQSGSPPSWCCGVWAEMQEGVDPRCK